MDRTDVRRAATAVCAKSATLFGLGFLALFVQLANAQGPLNYFQNYFVTGDYVVGGVGGLSTLGPNPTATINFSGVPCTTGPGLFASVTPCSSKGAVPADIIAAFLYWETIEPTASTTPTATAGTFDANLTSGANINPNASVPLSGLPLGSPQIPACVAGGGTESTTNYTRVYRADVLRYLNINANANVRTANYTHTIAFSGNPAGTQFLGATLVVVYRLVTPGTPKIAPLRSVVIYDGAFTGVASRSPSLNQTMGGFYQASSNPNAKMTQIVGGGQKGYNETLTLNGGVPQGVPSNPFVGAQGTNWDNYTFNYNLPPNASSVQTAVQSTNDCLSWGAIVTSTNVQDSDFDGLLDIWEKSGLYLNPGVRNDGIPPSQIVTPTTAATFGTCTPQNGATCVNFPAMGANPSVPDIFIQLDWMSGTYSAPHAHNPQLAALNMVGSAFKSHGINLHFDVGGSSTYQTAPASPYIIPATYAQGGNVVQESSVLCLSSSNCNFWPQSEQFSVLGWKTGFGAIKDGDPNFTQPNGQAGLPQLFAQNRKDSFHYGLFGHAIAASTALSAPEAGSISGVGDLPGGDFMVTLGLWRSDIPGVDQVGTMLDEAGTLMHELGHNLGLKHGGWNDTPVCMPNYPSVMNYLYQVSGLTDAAGNEHIDYSYGLNLPMSEDFLSSLIPMGIQNYAVRYFGPFNSSTNTPGQASVVSCNGQLPNTFGTSEAKYVRLQGTSVSTPDWSNGTVPPGKLITNGLDINYDGIIGQTFTDSPDWLSLNLQQVSARANVDGASTNLGKSDIGKSDIGKSDIGTPDLGKSDIGTAALGQDALGDEDYATYVLSGTLSPPSGLTASVYVPPASTAGGTGNVLNWTANTGVASQYNVYRCNNSTGTCTFALLASINSTSGNPPVVTPTYTDVVNDNVHAGSTCPSTSTCYNTTYNYYVTEVNAISGLATETGASNTVSGDVTHMTVVANSKTVTYGATNPTPTFTVYSNAAPATALTGVTCAYTPTPSANTGGYYDAGNYPITCAGPTVVSGTTEGVTYYSAASAALLYPSNLGGTTQGLTQGSLTINPLPITVTAVFSTKVYNATTAAGKISSSSLTTAIPTITTNSLVPSDTAAFTESYDNSNVNPAIGSHVMTPAGSVNDNNGGRNYKVTFVPSAATSVITPAPATITATTNTKTYDGTTSAAAIPATTVACGGSTATGPPSLCGPDTVTSLIEMYSSPNVGNSVPITVSPGYVINDGNGGKNYTISTTGTTGVIQPAPVTTTAGSYSGIYSGATQSPSACTVTPNAPNTFVGTVTCTNNTASFGPNAGSGTVTPVPAVGASDSLNNYAITPVNGSWNIAKAMTTTTINPVTPSPTDPNVPVTVTVTVTPTTPVAVNHGPTQSVSVSSLPGSPTSSTCPVTLSGVSGTSNATGSCTLTFAAAGPQSITVTYSGDSNFSNVNSTASTSLTVNPPLSLPAASLPAADQNMNYQQTLLASGGVAVGGTGYYWAVTSGALPAGLSLGTAGTVGGISGSPTASPGQYTFGVSVTDALGAIASQIYSITVDAPPSLTGGTLPNALVGTPYNYNIPVTAGTPPFTNWTCSNCATNLPAGLSFNNGNISGTATGIGTGNINVSVSDAAGATALAMYTITADTFTSAGFSGPYQLQNWNVLASNGGTTNITPSSGPSTSAQFAYSVNLGGGGVPAQTWTFQDTAAATGTVSFNWQYTGFHAYFEVTALLQVFDGSNMVTLYNPPVENCCTSPSGGFSVSGTATINVNQGDTFGWIVGGSNFDSNSVLNGTLTITNFSAPLSTPATFSATGSMNIARSNPSATLLQNGQVLIAGGFDGSNPLASAELYDPATGLFTVTGSMSAARYVHTATLLPNGQVLIAGGQSYSDTLAGAELYNPVTGTFSATGSMNAARQNQIATLLQNGQVLIAAGNDNSTPLASAELYDPATGLFSLTGSMGTARYVPMAALLPNGQVLIAGGITSPNPTYVASAELYDPTMGTFSYTGSMSTARGYFTATALQNGQVLAAGGYNGFTQVTTAELYNPTTGMFGLTGSMTNLQGGPATLLGNGQVLFAGGYNGSSLATSELYDPTAGMFNLTGSMTTPRNGPAATLLANGQVLVVGGTGNSGVLASAELYAPPN